MYLESRYIHSLILALGSGLVLLLSPLAPAFATVINTTNTTDILNAIGVPDGTTATYSGDSAAVGYSTTPLANFPPGSDISFGILSSGQVSDITQANTSGNQGTDLGSSGTSGDSATLTLNLQIPQSPQKAAAVGFNFTFLSEEYPEFVGSSFNDRFRAFLNGTNIALDTSAQSIDVNNNFFNSGLTPTGTFFDGQTPPLTVRAALPDNATSATLSFNVADVGDGVYDSAAFIQGVEYYFPQTVYLAFDEGDAEIPVNLYPFNYTKPSAGLSSAEKATVVNNVQSIFDDFLIEVTDTKPTGGDYSTIYAGGTKDDLPSVAQFFFSESTLGKAESLDLGNNDKNDFALVFSGESFFENADGTANLGNLSQVIAHEAGHILGLFHVEPSSELLYPYAGGLNRDDISDSDVNRAEIDSNKKVSPVGATQNSYQELARNVGLENASIIIGEPSLTEQLLKNIKIIFGSLSSTVYNAKLAVLLSDDAFPSFYDLGDLAFGEVIELSAPIGETFGAFLFGSSTLGGNVDIFGTSNLLGGFDPAFLNINDLLTPLTGTPILSLYESDDVGFSKIGLVTLDLANASTVPEPSVLSLLMLGLLAMSWPALSRSRSGSHRSVE